MSEINDTPAFPTSNWQKAVPMSSGYSEGMSMRDYFAAKVLQATCYPAIKDAIDNDDDLEGIELARICYGLADAMLIVRAEDE